MANDFVSLGISEDFIEKLRKSGIKEPTPVQEAAIPEILKGADIVGQSQTGTGKTLAFALPILEKINAGEDYIQALVITPTRELAIQITSVFKKLTADTGINMLSVYGGQEVESQIKKLKGPVHIVIGTPGRLIDHIDKKTVDFHRVRLLVLDEADVMLKMGFVEDVERILKKASPVRQTMLFSATIPKGIRMIAKRYMRNPVDVTIRSKNITLEEIDQVAFETNESEKQEMLLKLLKLYNPFMSIIFCSTKRRVEALAEAVFNAGYLVEELHGDLTQTKRERIMKSFRELKLQVLVATDIAARGLDIEGVTHVFNYDLPHKGETYIHRIGRTGRAGEKGTAVTLYTQRDRFYLDIIEKEINKKIEKNVIEGGVIKPVKKRVVSEEGIRKTAKGKPRGFTDKALSGRAERRGRKTRQA